jgi:hypothetical protein
MHVYFRDCITTYCAKRTGALIARNTGTSTSTPACCACPGTVCHTHVRCKSPVTFLGNLKFEHVYPGTGTCTMYDIRYVSHFTYEIFHLTAYVLASVLKVES